MPHTYNSVRRDRGAALLLLLMILGLTTAGTLISVFSRQQSELKHELQSQIQLSTTREALLGFVARTGRLPRPATSATDGRERTQECENDASCTGFIPWVTLGIDGFDGWGKLIRYSVTPAFTEAPIRPVSAGDKKVMGRTVSGEFYYQAGQSECPVYAQCPPAVIFSNGRNNLGTSAQGARFANTAENNVDERKNDTAVDTFLRRPPTNLEEAIGGPFDDVLIWISAQQLNQRLRVAPLY